MSYFLLCAVLCLVIWLCLAPWNPLDCDPPGSFMHWNSPGKNTGVDYPCPPPGNLPNPGIELRSPALQVDYLLSEPPGKPMNPGVGSLSLFQGISLTQESNPGLLYCRWILYQLSYQGSPTSYLVITFFFKFYFIFKLYIIVLVLPNIKMNPPQVYMCSPSWTLLPPPSSLLNNSLLLLLLFFGCCS